MTQLDYKVLHVINDVETGGAQTLLENLARHRLPHQRLELCVLGGRGVLSDRLTEAFDFVTYLDFDRSSNNVLKLVRQLSRVIHDRGPQVLHTHLLQADLASALCPASIPRVSTIHTTGMTADGDRLRSRMLGRVSGLLARRFQAVIACDPTCLSWMQRMNYPTRAVSVVRNGVPTGDGPADHPEPSTVLSLARWHGMKDHRTLFTAVKILLDRGVALRLVCAGSDMSGDNEALAALVSETGVGSAVDLLGSQRDVRRLLTRARALVISSAYGEALPMAGIEALAVRRPVVTTDVGGCSELAVDPRLLVPPRQPERLADALADLLSRTEADWLTLSDAAHELATRKFSIETTVTSYDHIYRGLVTPAPARASGDSRHR